MEFSFGILSDKSPMSYRQSDSPRFDGDAETDQATVNSDDSAETVTVEVMKTPPTCLLRSASKKTDTPNTNTVDQQKKRILLRRGKIKMLHNLEENINADAKVSQNLCPSLFHFKEA